jgi:cellulose synthase/poly-beta-1,6-N-acetylglucosamine synthase-like glycosyltransferase
MSEGSAHATGYRRWAPGTAPGGNRVAPVTVVIPAYQRETIFATTVRSVLEQSLPVAEVLVVDDGSTDRTAEVAEALGVAVLRQ